MGVRVGRLMGVFNGDTTVFVSIGVAVIRLKDEVVGDGVTVSALSWLQATVHPIDNKDRQNKIVR